MALAKLQNVSLNAESSHSNIVCRVMYIILFILCILFAVTCAIMIAIYFVTAGILVNFLEKHPHAGNMSVDSIPDGLTSFTTHMDHFMEDGVSTGQDLTNTSLFNFVASTEVRF